VSSLNNLKKLNFHSLFFLILILSCDPNPQGGSGNLLTSRTESENDLQDKPLVTIDPNLELIFIQGQDLDSDPELEQIIVTYDRNQPQSPMELLIIKNDVERELKYIAWRTRLNAVGKNSLFIQVLDIIGDHRQEIAVSGIDGNGWQTLEIFKRKTDQVPVLSFESIFSKAVNGLIEIQKMPRSEGYSEGLTEQISFPIIMEEVDSQSSGENIDILRSSWFYRVQENTFVMSKIERITRKAMLNSGENDYSQLDLNQFLSKLNGLWVKEDQRNISLDFRQLEKRFVIGLGQTSEIYDWLNTQRPRSNVINILGTNVLTLSKRIPLQTQMNILMVNDSQILVLSSFPDDFFQGSYQKMEGVGFRTNTSRFPIDISGEFIGDDDLRIIFQAPHIKWIQNSQSLEGAFSLFFLNEWLIQIRLFDPNSDQPKNLVFKISHQEIKENINKKIILTLEPVTLTIKGIEIASGKKFTLQKVISLDS